MMSRGYIQSKHQNNYIDSAADESIHIYRPFPVCKQWNMMHLILVGMNMNIHDMNFLTKNLWFQCLFFGIHFTEVVKDYEQGN